MFGIDFTSLSAWWNAAVFAAAAAVVWFAGARISQYADTLSTRLNLGKAFVGLLFLALATETPEIGTTLTAVWHNNPSLALNNIFGGVVLQTAVLVVVDIALVRGALTYFVPQSVLILQGVLLILLLGSTLVAVVAGEQLFIWSVGAWTLLLFGGYVASLYLSQQYENKESWVPADNLEKPEHEQKAKRWQENKPEAQQQKRTTSQLIFFFLSGTVVILLAGMILAHVAEALATQTGLGTSFIGATLLAFSTSLPELSTAITAVKLGNYQMAVSNIFGSNSIMVALLFLADLFYREGPILNEAGPSVLLTTAMGIVVTAVYMVGMVERRNRTFLGMGIDSVLVIIFYLVSVALLYTLRGQP